MICRKQTAFLLTLANIEIYRAIQTQVFFMIRNNTGKNAERLFRTAITGTGIRGTLLAGKLSHLHLKARKELHLTDSVDYKVQNTSLE